MPKSIFSNSLLLILSTSIILFCSGCATTEEKDWRRINGSNDIDSYQEYLAKYPKGRYTKHAELNLDKSLWEQALRINTIDAYEAYLKDCQLSACKNAAASKVIIKDLKEKEEKLEFERAMSDPAVARQRFIESIRDIKVIVTDAPQSMFTGQITGMLEGVAAKSTPLPGHKWIIIKIITKAISKVQIDQYSDIWLVACNEELGLASPSSFVHSNNEKLSDGDYGVWGRLIDKPRKDKTRKYSSYSYDYLYPSEKRELRYLSVVKNECIGSAKFVAFGVPYLLKDYK